MSPSPPNILLILTDDQGWDDLGWHGNDLIDTPRLDDLAAESVNFDHFYVNPVCAPTRAALLTGRDFLRTGVSHVHGGKDFIHPDETLLPEVFRRAGYRTGMWGKWHSGKTTGYFPWERGFDEAYMAQLYRHRDGWGRLNGARVDHPGWTVDILTDYALRFISEQSRSARPWLAFLPYLTVHGPLLAPGEMVARYRDRGMGEALATTYAMIEQLDANIGRLLDHLDATGQAENTVVLFLSDNGPQFWGDQFSRQDYELRYVSGYKGHKGDLWENGVRSPLLIRWPGRFAARRVQAVCDVTDLLPTLADLCGIDLSGHPLPLDGRSFAPALFGREDEVPAKDAVIFSNLGWSPVKTAEQQAQADRYEYAPAGPQSPPLWQTGQQLMALRRGPLKLLINPGLAEGAPEAAGGEVLVDLAADPLEDRNVAAEHPGRAAEMRQVLHAWFEQVRDHEPHAFHTPRFVIGEGASNVVLLYAPRKLHGDCLVAPLRLARWQGVGEGGDYLVRVKRAGPWRLDLRYDRFTGGALHVSVAVGQARLGATIDGRDTDGGLGVMELPAGDHDLQVRVEAIDGEATTLDGIEALTFTAVEPP
jgi:arylsulfatase A-like enzyme